MPLALHDGMRNLHRFMAAAAVVLATAATGCVASDGGDSSLTISNRSSYFLTEIYVAEVSDPNWGPDLVPGDLAPGEDLIVTNISCGTYDVLVVDDTGVDCELQNLELCFTDDAWVIDDVTLDVCAFNPVR